MHIWVVDTDQLPSESILNNATGPVDYQPVANPIEEWSWAFNNNNGNEELNLEEVTYDEQGSDSSFNDEQSITNVDNNNSEDQDEPENSLNPELSVWEPTNGLSLHYPFIVWHTHLCRYCQAAAQP